MPGRARSLALADKLGALLAGVFAEPLLAKLGPARLYLLSHGLLSVGFLIIALGAPWLTGLTLALLPVGFSTSLNVTLGHVLYAGCPVTLGFIYGTYGFGATVRLLAAGHSKAWHDYKLLAWVTLVTGGLAAWMFWEDMGAVRRRKMEDRRGSIFAAGERKNILLMAWFVFAYRAVEVALTRAALAEVAEILMRGGGSGREENPGRPLSWYWADPGVHGGWLFWAGITVGRIVLLLRGLIRPEGIGYHRTRFLDVSGPVAWILMALLWGPGKHSPLQSLAQGGSFTAGYAMGPVYPIAIMELTQTMGAQELIGGIGIVSAAGGYGAAVMPFVSMALADHPGLYRQPSWGCLQPWWQYVTPCRTGCTVVRGMVRGPCRTDRTEEG